MAFSVRPASVGRDRAEVIDENLDLVLENPGENQPLGHRVPRDCHRGREPTTI